MALQDLFRLLTEFFRRERYDFAVIGACALYAYGYVRATRDVDMLTRFEYQPTIVAYLESLGFETLHRSDGYSNHLLAIETARIDLVYVDGGTAEAIFQSTRPVLLFGTEGTPVVSPEHLVLLKLFAIHNDPGRKFKELADIRELIRVTAMDLDGIRRQFARQGLEESFDEIIRHLPRKE